MACEVVVDDKDGGFVQLPPGLYTAQITDFHMVWPESGMSKTYLAVKSKVSSGDYTGAVINDKVYAEADGSFPKTMWRISQISLACGVPSGTRFDVHDDGECSHHHVGKFVQILMKNEEYNGKTQAKPSTYSPADAPDTGKIAASANAKPSGPPTNYSSRSPAGPPATGRRAPPPPPANNSADDISF